MEFRLASVLIESAVKLACFSDCVDVFVIVDTPAGRLFSGNGGLLESFAASALTPLANDLRLYVDPFNPPQMAPIALSSTFFSQQPTHSSLRQSRDEPRLKLAKRSRPTVENLDDSPAVKAKRQTGETTIGDRQFRRQSASMNGEPNGSDASNPRFIDDSAVALTSPDTSSANHDHDSSQPADTNVAAPRSSLANGSTAESLYDDRATSKIVKTEFPPSSDSLGEEWIELSSGDESSSSYSLQRHSSNRASFAENADFVTNVRVDDANADPVAFVNAAVPSLKLEAFRSASGELVSSRGSVENRLASSVAYDAGKALADLKPESVAGNAAKAFFNHQFETWISQFDHLREHLKTMIPNGKPELGQTFTLLALLKMTARAAFKQKLKTKAKR